METIHFPDDPRPPWLVHPVLALGNFDGLHRGHFKIIERVRRGAAEHGGTPMAMTFDPHPPRVLRSPTAQLSTGGGRLPRRQPKSNGNGNGVAQPKSVRCSTVSHWLGGDEMHARRWVAEHE